MEIRLGGFDDFVQADMVMEVTNVDGEFDQRNADVCDSTTGKSCELELKIGTYPLVNVQKLWKITMFNGKTYYFNDHISLECC